MLLERALEWLQQRQQLGQEVADNKQFAQMRKLMKSPGKMKNMMRQMGGMEGMGDMMKGLGGKLPF